MHTDLWDNISRMIKSAHFLAANERQAKVLEQFLRGNISFIHYPFQVDQDLEQINIQDTRKEICQKYNVSIDDKILIYAGRLSIQKNISLLVEIMNELPQDYKLLLCGKFDDIAHEQRDLYYLPGLYFSLMNQKLNTSQDNIILCGNLEPRSLVKHYIAADQFISLSSYLLEDYGVAPLEAYSYGCDLILSNWGGFANFSNLSNTQLIDTCLMENYVHIDTEKSLQAIRESKSKKSINKISEQQKEIEQIFNKNFLKSIENILKIKGKPFSLKSTKAKWRLDDQKDNILYYKIIHQLSSRKEKDASFSKASLFLQEANDNLVLPPKKMREGELSKKFEFHFYNYFNHILPCFIDTLLTTSKEIKSDKIYLRDGLIDTSSIDELFVRYPEKTFYIKKEVYHQYSFDKLIPVSLVSNVTQKEKLKLIVNAIILKEDESSINLLLQTVKNYKEIILIENEISPLKLQDKTYHFERVDKLLDDLGAKYQIVSFENIANQNFKTSPKEFDYLSLLTPELIGDSFEDYYFLSLGYFMINGVFADKYDFAFSLHHGIKIEEEE